MATDDGGFEIQQTTYACNGAAGLQCNGLQPEIYVSSGWANYGAPCSGSTPACLRGVCVACNPGAMQCLGNGVQTCNSTGQWGSAVACINQTCVSGTNAGSVEGGVAGCVEPCCATGNTDDCTNSGTGTRCKSGVVLDGACVGSVAKSAEVCDGIDNDCNGAVDDVAGIGTSCSSPSVSTTGACVAGYACTGSPGPGPSGLTCVQVVGPTVETCNGVDDDCDGTVDDNLADVGSACCYTGTLSDCSLLGLRVCVNGVLVCSGSS